MGTMMDDEEYELDVYGLKHIDTSDENDQLHYLDTSDDTLTIRFSLETTTTQNLRDYLARTLHPKYFRDEYLVQRSLNEMTHQQLVRLQARHWSTIPQVNAARPSSDPDTSSEIDASTARMVAIIAECIQFSNRVFVYHEWCPYKAEHCHNPMCDAVNENLKKPDGWPCVMIEPLIHVRTLVLASDLNICGRQILLFRRDELMFREYGFHVPETVKSARLLCFCIPCLEFLWKNRVRAWKLLGYRPSRNVAGDPSMVPSQVNTRKHPSEDDGNICAEQAAVNYNSTHSTQINVQTEIRDLDDSMSSKRRRHEHNLDSNTITNMGPNDNMLSTPDLPQLDGPTEGPVNHKIPDDDVMEYEYTAAQSDSTESGSSIPASYLSGEVDPPTSYFPVWHSDIQESAYRIFPMRRGLGKYGRPNIKQMYENEDALVNSIYRVSNPAPLATLTIMSNVSSLAQASPASPLPSADKEAPHASPGRLRPNHILPPSKVPPHVICYCRQPARAEEPGTKPVDTRIITCACSTCPISRFHYTCLTKSQKISAYHGRWTCDVCGQLGEIGGNAGSSFKSAFSKKEILKFVSDLQFGVEGSEGGGRGKNITADPYGLATNRPINVPEVEDVYDEEQRFIKVYEDDEYDGYYDWSEYEENGYEYYEDADVYPEEYFTEENHEEEDEDEGSTIIIASDDTI